MWYVKTVYEYPLRLGRGYGISARDTSANSSLAVVKVMAN